jgi:hypothetical protein
MVQHLERWNDKETFKLKYFAERLRSSRKGDIFVAWVAVGISRWRMPGRPPAWDNPRERVPEPSLQAGKALTPGQQYRKLLHEEQVG